MHLHQNSAKLHNQGPKKADQPPDKNYYDAVKCELVWEYLRNVATIFSSETMTFFLPLPLPFFLDTCQYSGRKRHIKLRKSSGHRPGTPGGTKRGLPAGVRNFLLFTKKNDRKRPFCRDTGQPGRPGGFRNFIGFFSHLPFCSLNMQLQLWKFWELFSLCSCSSGALQNYMSWGPLFWPFLRSPARAPTIKAMWGTVAIQGVFDN